VGNGSPGRLYGQTWAKAVGEHEDENALTGFPYVQSGLAQFELAHRA